MGKSDQCQCDSVDKRLPTSTFHHFMARPQEYSHESTFMKMKCSKVTPKKHIKLHLSSPIQIKVDQSGSVDQQKAAVHIAASEVRGLYVTLKASSSHISNGVIITTTDDPTGRPFRPDLWWITSWPHPELLFPHLSQVRTKRLDQALLLYAGAEVVWSQRCCCAARNRADSVPLFVQAWQYQLFLSAVSASCCPDSMRQHSSKIKTCQRKNWVTEISGDDKTPSVFVSEK